MNETLNLFSPELLILIAITAVFAGMVKGIVGFAMPMILISGMTIFINSDRHYCRICRDGEGHCWFCNADDSY